MSTVSGVPQLVHLRRRLTAWYAATFGLILLLLGGGLYAAIHVQLSSQLGNSLRDAAHELVRAAHIREMESRSARGDVVDAVDELHIPDRTLYLVDSAGTPIKPAHAEDWIRGAARRAAKAGVVHAERDSANAHVLSLYAERFRLVSGELLVAVAVADEVELDDRYAALIAAFGGAAVAAVILVLAGGSFLVRKSTKPVERSVEHMRRFMADAAHELRTPISVMRAHADAALQAPRSPENDAFVLRGIGHEAQRLGRIVDDLLILARADAGERAVAREHFFLDDVVIDAAASVRMLAHAADVMFIADALEETPVVGDAALVRELAVVLLDNAVKFTRSGGTVRVRVTPGPPTLTVEDTGSGIAPEHLAHVFDRFYRGDASRPRQGRESGGAGLGLSIAQWIATAHDARITLDSAPGRGTRVTVTFPRPASSEPPRLSP